MKQVLVISLLLVASLSFAHGQTNASKSIEQELMRLQKAQDDAEGMKDLAALDRLLSDDFFFTSPGGAVTYKKQFLDDVKNAESDSNTVSYDEVKSRVYGNTAVVHYRLIVNGRGTDGNDFTNRFRNTVVWVKQHGKWRMVAIHVSRIRP